MTLKLSFFSALTLTFFFCNHNGYGQDWLVETCEIKGNVKSLSFKRTTYYSEDHEEWTNYTYEYNRQRYMIRQSRSSSNSGINYNSFYRIYDNDGTNLLEHYYIQSGDTASRRVFEYNELGNIQKKEIYHHGDWGTGKISTFNYEYNDKNLLIERFVVIEKSKDTNYRYYQYDDFGRMIKDSEIRTRTKKIKSWKYDENGKLIEEKLLDTNWASATYNELNEKGNWVVVRREDYSKKPKTSDSYVMHFTYNEQGQIIHENRTTIEGDLLSEHFYTYNDRGDRLTDKDYWAEKDETRNYTYDYKYDSNDNWIERITKIDGELFEEEKRKIKYY